MKLEKVLFKKGKELGFKHIMEIAPKVTDSRLVLGTRETLGDGARDLFAVGTYMGQWGLPPVEAIYRKAGFDDKGQKLNGNNEYIMHFKAPAAKKLQGESVEHPGRSVMLLQPLLHLGMQI